MMLKVILHEPKPLKWWHEQHLLDHIHMDPSYQRRSYIWSKWKRAHLIDSLLNDFDVPKFYIANFVEMPSAAMNLRKRPFAIIDGKQRFQAIFDFFDNKLDLNSSFVLDDDESIDVSGFNYLKLKAKYPHLASKIESFIPTVMDVITNDQNKIQELFVRLNSGEAATGAERRNAMSGPIPPILRDLVLHPFFQKKIRFATKRMQEFNLAAKLLLLEWKGGFADTKAGDLDKFAEEAAEWAEANDRPGEDPSLGPYGEARDRVYEVLEKLSAEFEDHDALLASQGNIPVYFWVVRNYPKLANELRDFLEQFTVRLRENLALTRDGARGDAELSTYYTMSRSTNDQASLEGRYKIFVKRLKAFSKPKPGSRRTA